MPIYRRKGGVIMDEIESREEQREMFGKFKGARDVIGYISFENIDWKNK